MVTDLTEIQNYLKDKQICLLGNARSILNTPKDIDKYEIVCRMNRGLSIGKEHYIGSKTDILFTSTKLSNSLILQFHTKYLVWMTKCQNLATDTIKQSAVQNPPEEWQELKDKYPENFLPSTGCIVINFLLKHIDFKTLHIYGFDFFASGTFYHDIKNQKWHPTQFEEKFIKDMIKDYTNVELIKC
jgi:hypothetical protein